jgi:hypothetical protein
MTVYDHINLPPTITHFTPEACCNALNRHYPDIHQKLGRSIFPSDIGTITLERSRVRVAFLPNARPLTYKLVDREWVCRAAWNPQWSMLQIRISPRIVGIIRSDGALWTVYVGFEDVALAQGFSEWLLDKRKCAWSAVRSPAERVSQPVECKVWGIDIEVLRKMQGKDMQGRGGLVEFRQCDRIQSDYPMSSVYIDGIEDDIIQQSAIPYVREQAAARGLFIAI